MVNDVSEHTNTSHDSSHTQSSTQHGDVTQRFPQLANIDSTDDAQRIEIFKSVLDQLNHELDTIK
ncbi:hypothetical protein D2E25_1199 [Bifidobacterium goeldii]|uniref:Uncharacterized protein n=1 Tax=Bifidobacterium goeldii TaxID=2306975 RepID=A0A430FK60_9BIFI|nr:hypothetical protein [Bifidobacterium goeldii]RSX53226.1 hypothetical protein D2E25_1199 [Bifidobacterium goeldii]